MSSLNHDRRPSPTHSLGSLALILISAGAAQAQPVEDGSRAEIVNSIVAALDTTYVFPDKAAEMGELLSANLEAGRYAEIAELGPLAETLTADLQSISHDKHLRVRELPPAAEPSAEASSTTRVSPAEAARRTNYGFESVRRLPGNVGYVDLRSFAAAEMGGARATAVGAMNFLASCDALIFDLRRNGGGSPSMIQLLSSYLFEGKVHLNTFYIRATDRHQEFWTHEEVDGPRMTEIPVYVLTSAFTLSAAEEFTYNLKTRTSGDSRPGA